MPARSNEFQAAVYLIKKHLAPDAVVTESRLFPDPENGDPREVDITIETQVGGHSIIIGFECIDHKRPATVDWVEKMHGKHLELPTHSVVLVSRSGFRPLALAKARRFNMETVTPSELTDYQA